MFKMVLRCGDSSHICDLLLPRHQSCRHSSCHSSPPDTQPHHRVPMTQHRPHVLSKLPAQWSWGRAFPLCPNAGVICDPSPLPSPLSLSTFLGSRPSLHQRCPEGLCSPLLLSLPRSPPLLQPSVPSPHGTQRGLYTYKPGTLSSPHPCVALQQLPTLHSFTSQY